MLKKHTHTRLITKHHFFPKFIHKKKPHVRYEPTIKLKLNSEYEDTDTAGSWNYDDSNPWESKINHNFAPGKKHVDWSLMRAAYDSNYDEMEIPNFSHKMKKPEYEPHYSDGEYSELKINPFRNRKPKNKYKIDYHQGDVYAPTPSYDYNNFHGYTNEKQFHDEEEEEADGSDRKMYFQPSQYQEPSYLKLTSDDHIDSPITYNQWPKSSQNEDSYQNWGGGGTTAGIDSYRTLPTVDEMDEILKYENYERPAKKQSNYDSNVYKIVKNKVKPKSQRHTTIISQSY